MVNGGQRLGVGGFSLGIVWEEKIGGLDFRAQADTQIHNCRIITGSELYK